MSKQSLKTILIIDQSPLTEQLQMVMETLLGSLFQSAIFSGHSSSNLSGF